MRMKNVIIPETLYMNYIYPGFMLLQSSLSGMFIGWIFQYPYPFKYGMKRLPNSIRWTLVMMMLLFIGFIVSVETFLNRTFNEVSIVLIGLSGMITIMLMTISCQMDSIYSRSFGRLFEFHTGSGISSRELKTLIYPLIFGEFYTILVYGSIGLILSWNGSYRRILEYSSLVTLLYMVLLFIGIGIYRRFPKDHSDPKNEDIPMEILESSSMTSQVFPPSPPLPILPQIIEKQQIPFQGARPPISSLRFNSIRRRQF